MALVVVVVVAVVAVAAAAVAVTSKFGRCTSTFLLIHDAFDYSYQVDSYFCMLYQ